MWYPTVLIPQNFLIVFILMLILSVPGCPLGTLTIRASQLNSWPKQKKTTPWNQIVEQQTILQSLQNDHPVCSTTKGKCWFRWLWFLSNCNFIIYSSFSFGKIILVNLQLKLSFSSVIFISHNEMFLPFGVQFCCYYTHCVSLSWYAISDPNELHALTNKRLHHLTLSAKATDSPYVIIPLAELKDLLA
jgi:hypothetical protein